MSDSDDAPIKCTWCDGNNHTMKSCHKRQRQRQRCSKTPYSSEDLKENDKLGFAAAGVLAWRRTPKVTVTEVTEEVKTESKKTESKKTESKITESNITESKITVTEEIEVLLAWESRKYPQSYMIPGAVREKKGRYLAAFNTLGGKRDFPTETAWDTALREFDEETGFQLKQMEYYRANRPIVHFSDKYALFIVELHPDDYLIDQTTKSVFLDKEEKICPSDQGLQHLQFVPLSDFLSQSVPLHSFTSNMIPHIELPQQLKNKI